ncbi:hypothetical protein BCR32DRAFT_265428 [Anaeromyces robustus]|uniref:Uncharacterized protein n=1 Tax=Anaeromyces robustus TaxID=1754192 RepID=A0A1Y1XJB0_9FUNG|nr:hypothetical protein BCR32DRAFT_265428 [Anaeromyces robustus]|eukprot:ORX85792.1 hypothetical protein BCR32DRAFT_265428 [Anaeromyces robustus]
MSNSKKVNKSDEVIIDVEKKEEKKQKLTFSCFRIGDSSSKAFVIRVAVNNQIFSIKEYISKSFEPKIIPRYLKLYVPISEEIFPDDPNLTSLKKFNQARREGVMNVIELSKPLKKISDEPYLCERIKRNPEALDIIILDDNLQKSIDNFVSNSMAELSFTSQNKLLSNNNISNDSLSREKMLHNNGSSSNFNSYDSHMNLYASRKNSKFTKTIGKVEGKVHIKNNKIKIPLLVISALLIIVIIGAIWYPRK